MVKKSLFLVMSFVLVFNVFFVCGTIDNDEGVVTYGMSSDEIFDYILKSAAEDAKKGMNRLDLSVMMKENPSENDFFSYLENKEYVYFIGHGNPNCISGNGFSDGSMCKIEIMYSCNENCVEREIEFKSKLVTLLSCSTLNNFGSTLLDKGVRCVVGWKDHFEASAKTAGDWSFYFYNCLDNKNGDEGVNYCIFEANSFSGLSGAFSKGDCGAFEIQQWLIPKEKNAKESSIEFHKLPNGEMQTDYSKYLSTKKRFNSRSLNEIKTQITEEEAIEIAEEYLQVPEDYEFYLVEEHTRSFLVVFKRYYDGLKVNMDEYTAAINKETGEVFISKKTRTDELPEISGDLSKSELLVKELEDKGIKVKSKERVIEMCDDEKPCVAWVFLCEEGEFEYYRFVNEETSEIF